MASQPRPLLTFRSLVCIASLLTVFHATSYSRDSQVRYLTYAEVEDTIHLFADSSLRGAEIVDSAGWDTWIREQDRQVRERIDRGVEDSISNFIAYGTSYTNLPRLQAVETSITDSGELSPEASARLRALVTGLESHSRVERVQLVRQFLAQKGIAQKQFKTFFTQNLKRFATEQRGYQEKLEEAGKAGDSMQVLLTRGTLYASRGLSVDTSLLPNYALEDTLRVMAGKGALGPGKIKRIAVIGPGLDFADKRDGYDFYPLQTIQPFAVIEAVLRLQLGNREDLHVITFDLNPMVNAHIAMLAKGAHARRAYVVQLPRDTGANWSPPAIAYWEHFGEILGTRAKPLPVPPALGGVALRAVSIAPKYATDITPLDLDIVAQTADFPGGQTFDLVVATNVLVYYDRFQQGLAMANIARLMNPGAIFLCNSVLPAQHEDQLVYLGRRSVTYSEAEAYGDDVVVYQKR
jgi:SAM-dependent methyltransferase